MESRLKPRSRDFNSFVLGADCSESPALSQASMQPEAPVPPQPTQLCWELSVSQVSHSGALRVSFHLLLTTILQRKQRCCYLPWEKWDSRKIEWKFILALAGVAQWIECWPANWKVTGWTPSQGTCLGCKPGPQLEASERQIIQVSLAHWCFSPLTPWPSL